MVHFTSITRICNSKYSSYVRMCVVGSYSSRPKKLWKWVIVCIKGKKLGSMGSTLGSMQPPYTNTWFKYASTMTFKFNMRNIHHTIKDVWFPCRIGIYEIWFWKFQVPKCINSIIILFLSYFYQGIIPTPSSIVRINFIFIRCSNLILELCD